MRDNLLLAGLVLALLPGSLCSLASADETNLVTNPGFEDGAPTSTHYLGVEGDSKDMKSRFAIDTKTVHSGAQSVLLQADGFARCSIGPKIPCHPLSGGDRYRVGVWIKPGADYQA